MATPLIRLVRMTFQPEEVGTFLLLFDRAAPAIRRFDGCELLELWQDADDGNVFITYSLWRDAKALEAYRRSEFFRETWGQVRQLFAAVPQVKNLTRARSHNQDANP